LSNYFRLVIEGFRSGAVSLTTVMDPDSDPEAQKHMDPTDPDPQHCF
jgi:hypothetical protein